mmetsp:Transcript_21436/g.46821  ORF Transcript_21436/g.46821 Transcript_21436/m.46821 type:complete len:138 (-) Transcript_21436:874-1287(-)
MAPLQQGQTMQSAPRDLANDMTMSVKLPQQCKPMAMSNAFFEDVGVGVVCDENDDVVAGVGVGVDAGSVVFVVVPGGKNKSFFVHGMGGMEKSSRFEGENENCRVWTFFKPASFALRSTSFNGYGFLSTKTNRTFEK